MTELSLPDRGEQLCSLDVSPTSQLICAGGSQGSLTMCAQEDIAVEALQANPYATPPELPEEEPPPPFFPMDAPVGTLPLPILLLPNPEPGFERCSAWPAAPCPPAWPSRPTPPS